MRSLLSAVDHFASTNSSPREALSPSGYSVSSSGPSTFFAMVREELTGPARSAMEHSAGPLENKVIHEEQRGAPIAQKDDTIGSNGPSDGAAEQSSRISHQEEEVKRRETKESRDARRPEEKRDERSGVKNEKEQPEKRVSEGTSETPDREKTPWLKRQATQLAPGGKNNGYISDHLQLKKSEKKAEHDVLSPNATWERDFLKLFAFSAKDLLHNESGHEKKGVKEKKEPLHGKTGAGLKKELNSIAHHNSLHQATTSDLVRVELDPAKWKVNGTAGKEELHLDAKIQRKHGHHQGDGQHSFDGEKGKGQDSAGKMLSSWNSQSESMRTASSMRTTSQLSDLPRTNFNDLVKQATMNLSSDGSSSASIKMNPEIMGRLTMNIQVHGNHVTASLIVDNESALKFVRGELEHLKSELAGHGIHVDQVAVKVRTDHLFQSAMGDSNNPSAGFQNPDNLTDHQSKHGEQPGNSEPFSTMNERISSAMEEVYEKASSPSIQTRSMVNVAV